LTKHRFFGMTQVPNVYVLIEVLVVPIVMQMLMLPLVPLPVAMAMMRGVQWAEGALDGSGEMGRRPGVPRPCGAAGEEIGTRFEVQSALFSFRSTALGGGWRTH
jgi:hypothetical protein